MSAIQWQPQLRADVTWGELESCPPPPTTTPANSGQQVRKCAHGLGTCKAPDMAPSTCALQTAHLDCAHLPAGLLRALPSGKTPLLSAPHNPEPLLSQGSHSGERMRQSRPVKS